MTEPKKTESEVRQLIYDFILDYYDDPKRASKLAFQESSEDILKFLGVDNFYEVGIVDIFYKYSENQYED